MQPIDLRTTPSTLIRIGGMTKGQIIEAFEKRRGFEQDFRFTEIRPLSLVRRSFRRATGSPCVSISGRAVAVLQEPSFTTAKKQRFVKVGNVSYRDLGFKEEEPGTFIGFPSLDMVTKRVEDLGGFKLPCETAAHLRLQYNNQPENSAYVVLTDPIQHRGSSYIFMLGYGLWDHVRATGHRMHQFGGGWNYNPGLNTLLGNRSENINPGLFFGALDWNQRIFIGLPD